MSYVVLARKYRPRTFAQMVGQEHVVQALTNALQQQRLHHAYLFTGTRGIGKTTVSRILAKSLNCTGPDGKGGITAEPCGVCQACTEIDADRYLDYIEMDAASNGGKDEIKDLIERAAYKPGVGRFKVFMIDEAHQLSKDAFNALLKTLEEPPEYLKFVLATTDPDKVLPTVLSRCLQFNLRPMAPATVREHLAHVLAAEAVPADDGALRLLARAARGSMRDGLSLADQAIAYGAGRLEESVVRTMLGSVDRGQARALVHALAQRDGAGVLAVVDDLRRHGRSAAGTLEELALLLQQMAVEQAVPGALDVQDPDTEDGRALAGVLAADETQLLYSMVVHGRGELHLMSDEYGALTMVLLRFLAFPPAARAAVAPGAEPAREPRTAPLRTPAPPALSLPALPPRAAPPAPPRPAPLPAADAALGDRWAGLVRQLTDAGLAGLVRELAAQGGLRAIDDATAPPTWHLLVERETLRTPALADKLAAAIAPVLGQPVRFELEPGAPEDSPARRDAAERQRVQAAAEALIRDDPVVLELLKQYKSARIVPGSIKPV
jgi:DNA polymerase-3 subunit gamma/tau